MRPQPSSLAQCTRPAEFRHRSPRTAVVPRLSLRLRRACSFDKLRRITRGSGRPLIRPFLLWIAWSALIGALLAQPESRRRRPASSPRPSLRSCVHGTSLKVTVLAPPLLFPVSHLPARDCSPEYSSFRRGLPFAIWSSQPRSHKTDPAIVSPDPPQPLQLPGPTSCALRDPVRLASGDGAAVPAGSAAPGFSVETKPPGVHPDHPTPIGRPDFN